VGRKCIYAAPQKIMANFIPAGRLFTAQIGQSQTIFLSRLAQPIGNTSLLAAWVPIPGKQLMKPSIPLKAGCRLGMTAGSLKNAVVIHRVTDYAPIVMDPDNTGNPNIGWHPGETFNDAANGISISVISQTTTDYYVRIISTLVLCCYPGVSHGPLFCSHWGGYGVG